MSPRNLANRSNSPNPFQNQPHQPRQSGPFTVAGKVVTLATNNTDGPAVRAARGIVLATNSPINRRARRAPSFLPSSRPGAGPLG
jgi:hypothetical protein